EDFRNLEKERRQFIKQWEDAIKAMNKREELIKAAGEKFAAGKVALRNKKEELAKQKEHLEIHIVNNKEMEGKITKMEREVAKHRNELSILKKNLSELVDETEVIKNTLAKVLLDLSNSRIYNQQRQEDLRNAEMKLKKMEDLKEAKREEFYNQQRGLY